MDIKNEFHFMQCYAKESDFSDEFVCERLRILWTAFCLHHNLDVDTHTYDCYLHWLWSAMDGMDVRVEDNFNDFDEFMCVYLV